MVKTYYTEDGVFVRETEKAIVRIHPGKLTEAERNEVIKNAAIRFWEAIERQKSQQTKACS